MDNILLFQTAISDLSSQPDSNFDQHSCWQAQVSYLDDVQVLQLVHALQHVIILLRGGASKGV